MRNNLPILASGSRFRRAMLDSAGIDVEIIVPEIDEDAHKLEFLNRVPSPGPGVLACHLASLKAESVSRAHPGHVVIGSDQVLAFEGEIFSKPVSIDDARQHLRRLRGNTNELLTAVVLAVNGETVWSHLDRAQLKMRAFTDAFLDAYVLRQGERLLTTVGAYEVEGYGSQLFERIDGDHFTIVGLPLIPLQAELRRRNILPS